MKKEIHANYTATQIKCSSCGQEFEVNSLIDSMNLESCNNCHPAYTGESKSKKAAGRVEQFNKKFGL